MADRKRDYARARAEIAERILNGAEPQEGPIDVTVPFELSTETLQGYITLDWEFRKEIRKLQLSIQKYLRDPTRPRPLNVLLFAPAGAGKSHFVRCLCDSLESMKVSAVEYNMSALETVQDLESALQEARNEKVLDRNPILFLDEIDSRSHHYATVLPLMWDGSIDVRGRRIRLGRVVLVVAGSTRPLKACMDSMRGVKADGQNHDFEIPDKLPDFLSRINGGVLEIPALDDIQPHIERNRKVDKVCIMIELLRRRFGEQLSSVQRSVLAFAAETEFRYGVRSLRHVVELLEAVQQPDQDAEPTEFSLPLETESALRQSSLVYHLSQDEVSKVVARWQALRSVDCPVAFHTPTYLRTALAGAEAGKAGGRFEQTEGARAETLAERVLAQVPALQTTRSEEGAPFDLIVVTPERKRLLVVVKGFSSIKRWIREVTTIQEIRWQVDRVLLEWAWTSADPVALFLMDVDSEHGRFVRLDTISKRPRRGPRVTVRLPRTQRVSKQAIQRLIASL